MSRSPPLSPPVYQLTPERCAPGLGVRDAALCEVVAARMRLGTVIQQWEVTTTEEGRNEEEIGRGEEESEANLESSSSPSVREALDKISALRGRHVLNARYDHTDTIKVLFRLSILVIIIIISIMCNSVSLYNILLF